MNKSTQTGVAQSPTWIDEPAASNYQALELEQGAPAKNAASLITVIIEADQKRNSKPRERKNGRTAYNSSLLVKVGEGCDFTITHKSKNRVEEQSDIHHARRQLFDSEKRSGGSPRFLPNIIMNATQPTFRREMICLSATRQNANETGME
ncbi:hypothetical protein CEXT_329081 [Caerostris extrusa]|uniref:Uncharacterized protein n=1 Tax=Caerostris extrusa TaxID=172846 RepID=A0AAV4NQA7_CAEEX|nr:hypothetical protein CEXT_329081 [Caerostris extrusa]